MQMTGNLEPGRCTFVQRRKIALDGLILNLCRNSDEDGAPGKLPSCPLACHLRAGVGILWMLPFEGGSR